MRLFFLWCVVFAVGGVISCGPGSAIRKKEAEDIRLVGEGHLAEGNVSAALGEFLKAEQVYQDDPHTHYDLGIAYFSKEEYERAIAHFEKAAALQTDYSEAYNALGTVYLRLEEWDEAIASFNRAKANLIYATPFVVLNNLGEAYRGKGDLERAIAFYRKALEDNPRFPNAHRGMGLTYMEMGDFEAAIAALEKAAQYTPGFAPVYFDLGLAYAGHYQADKAIEAFRQAMSLDPESSLAERASMEIKKLEASIPDGTKK